MAEKGTPEERPRMKQWKGMGSYGTVGLEVVLSILVGLFFGRYLDSKFDTEPVIAIVGFCAGVGAGIKAIVRAMKEMREAAKREEEEEGNPAPMFPKEEWGGESQGSSGAPEASSEGSEEEGEPGARDVKIDTPAEDAEDKEKVRGGKETTD